MGSWAHYIAPTPIRLSVNHLHDCALLSRPKHLSLVNAVSWNFSELSKAVFQENAFISNSVTLLKEGNRLSGKASFTLLEYFFQLNAQARHILRFSEFLVNFCLPLELWQYPQKRCASFRIVFIHCLSREQNQSFCSWNFSELSKTGYALISNSVTLLKEGNRLKLVLLSLNTSFSKQGIYFASLNSVHFL